MNFGDENEGIAEFSFECAKCGGSWCRFAEMRGPSGAFTAYFDLDIQSFTAVICKNCRFTEFYAGPVEGFKSRFGLEEDEWDGRS